MANGKILKQSHDHNHAPFVGDMSSYCQNWYSLCTNFWWLKVQPFQWYDWSPQNFL